MILLTGDASVKYGSRLNYTTRMFCDNCLVCMVPYMYTGEKLEYDLGSNQKVEQLPTKRETALKLNMRAAVAALIDRDRVIDRTVSGYGFQYDWPCMDNSVFRKSIGQLSASENLAAVYLGNEGYTHTGGNAYWYKDTDYDKAKPLTVNFVVDSEDVELIHACDAIVSSLKAIGIKTNVKAATGTEYTRLFLSGEYDYGFFRLYTGFCPDLSGMFANGSIFNYNGYDTGNARYAAGRLLKEWRQQGTGDAYAAEFAAMAAVRLENLFEIFKTELPFDGLYMRANCLLISGRVTVGAKTGTQAWDIFDGVQEWYIS